MTAPVTVETLTDADIREEMDALRRDQDELDARPTTRQEGRDAYVKSCVMSKLIQSGRVALKEKRARRGDSRTEARQRICAAINARREAKP